MAVRVLLVLATFAVLYGCGQASSPVEKQEKQGGVEQAKPEPVAAKECSDFASGQEAFVFEQSGKATEADKKNLDPDGDGIFCNHKGVQWKDTRTQVEGLPPFEVAFVVDGNVPGLKTGEITIDISSVNKPDKVLLEAVTWEAIEQVGTGTETGYRAAIISYRDAETYKELDALGIYVADQEAAERVNSYVREKGWKIDFYTGEVPPEGYVAAYTFYG